MLAVLADAEEGDHGLASFGQQVEAANVVVASSASPSGPMRDVDARRCRSGSRARSVTASAGARRSLGAGVEVGGGVVGELVPRRARRRAGRAGAGRVPPGCRSWRWWPCSRSSVAAVAAGSAGGLNCWSNGFLLFSAVEALAVVADARPARRAPPTATGASRRRRPARSAPAARPPARRAREQHRDRDQRDEQRDDGDQQPAVAQVAVEVGEELRGLDVASWRRRCRGRRRSRSASARRASRHGGRRGPAVGVAPAGQALVGGGDVGGHVRGSRSRGGKPVVLGRRVRPKPSTVSRRPSTPTSPSASVRTMPSSSAMKSAISKKSPRKSRS